MSLIWNPIYFYHTGIHENFAESHHFKYLKLEILVRPNWKWWVLDSSRRVARISDHIQFCYLYLSQKYFEQLFLLDLIKASSFLYKLQHRHLKDCLKLMIWKLESYLFCSLFILIALLILLLWCCCTPF